jgi:hypothetical protein
MLWPAVVALFCLLTSAALLPAEDNPPPGRAAERMKLPAGFRATLVAGEPQLVKPIAMTTDDRGRSLTF